MDKTECYKLITDDDSFNSHISRVTRNKKRGDIFQNFLNKSLPLVLQENSFLHY